MADEQNEQQRTTGQAAAPDNPAEDPGQEKPTITEPAEVDPAAEQKRQEAKRQAIARLQEANKAITEAMSSPEMGAIKTAVNGMWQEIEKATGVLNTLLNYLTAESMASIRQMLEQIAATAPAWLELIKELEELTPYLEAELKKPEYGGKTLDELMEETETDEDGEPVKDSLLSKALDAARAAKSTVDAQIEGRRIRQQLKENAINKGAVMELKGDTMPIFSSKELWDAFAPGRISKMGELCKDAIDAKTGRLDPYNLQQGAIIQIDALDISYKILMLLSAITANSVENYREYFIQDGTIKFYVKGVLDSIDVDPRIRDDMQLNLDRKTAGVLYLEKQLEPLLSFIGTAPDGNRYSVLNYDGYDVESDTMTIRTPYLFRLWNNTQLNFSDRKRAKELRIAEGKRPLKSDLKPLEINHLMKAPAFKEDDTVLEIAAYITNTLLIAGNGAHKTEISFRKLIKNCSRLQQRLEEIDRLPNTEKMPDGKKRNNTARYNTELRKIAKAYNLIMDPAKCDALKHFQFEEFTPTKGEGANKVFIAPTKSTIDGKIVIKWKRIESDHD